MKLADFGLTKELEDDEEIYEIKSQKQIPVRWAAVELMSQSIFNKSNFFLLKIIFIRFKIWSHQKVTCGVSV